MPKKELPFAAACVKRFAMYWANAEHAAVYELLMGAVRDVRASALVEHLTRLADALERHAFACRLAARAAKGEDLMTLKREWDACMATLDEVHGVTRGKT